MSIWEKYTPEQRQEYKEYLEMYGKLSALFNQKSSNTGAPYLDSKFQETIYARSFDSENVDIGNTPHDIQSTFGSERIGIGVKTWLDSRPSYQKVMQLKSFKTEIEELNTPKKADDLAFLIAKIKNDKLITDQKRLGLSADKNIYHYVTRDKGKLTLSETSYPLININKLKVKDFTNTSFTFTDGQKKYKYTFGDSQVWMYFNPKQKDTEILDEIQLELLEDPFKFLYDAFKNKDKIYIPQKEYKDYLYLPLYSYKYKKVLESSGLNSWNGKPKTPGSTKPRPEGEAYIPIPSIVWKKYPYWVDPKVDMRKYKEYKETTGLKNYKIKLHLPDGQIIDAIFGQSDFKALQTKPQNILGNWILNILNIKNPQRERYDKPATNIVTMEKLEAIGYDSVKLWHENPDNLKDVWIDFAETGSFNKFIKDEII